MAPLTAAQQRIRDRVELGIRLASPALDLVLAVGDRVSRLVERNRLGDGDLRAPTTVGAGGRRPARRALPPGFERAGRERDPAARR